MYISRGRRLERAAVSKLYFIKVKWYRVPRRGKGIYMGRAIVGEQGDAYIAIVP